MARPRATELTPRELAVMQVFWKQRKGATADDAVNHLRTLGEELAYVTVANVVRGLADKGFLRQINQTRPYEYKAIRSHRDVSRGLVSDLVKRLFSGSREAMLVHLLENRKLTDAERTYLEDVLKHQEDPA